MDRLCRAGELPPQIYAFPGPFDERGVCTEPRQTIQITADVDLPLFIDMTQGFERPQLYDEAGEVVPTDVVTEEISQLEKWVALVPRDELQQLSRYEVRYPEGTTNMFGAPHPVDQLNWFVETVQGPLTVVETEPANGAVDVPLDATIRVTFSGPVAFYNDGNDFILDQQVGMEVSRVPVTFRERPGYVFEIEPEALVPSATYTLTLTDGLRALEDGNLRPLVDAPVTVVFQTAAQ